MPENWESSTEGRWQPRDYASVLAEIEKQQPDFPDMWGEVRRFASPQTAADRALRLKKKYGDHFEFRSTKDQQTGEGITWARYIGGEGDRDVLDSQD